MAAFEPPPLLLTPIDNVLPRRHIPKLLFFPESRGSDVSTIVNTFRDGLSKTLKAIPTLTGTVKGVGQKGALCVAAPWRTVNEILQVKDMRHEGGLDYRSLREKEFPINGLEKKLLLPMAGMTKTEKSVLLVQVNIIRGGMVMALCFHHSFTDGNGSIAITSGWAACCRRDDISPLLTPEMMDRDRLMRGWGNADIAEFPGLGTPPSEEIAPSSGTTVSGWLTATLRRWTTSTKKSEVKPPPQAQEAVFFFSKHKLAALKALASEGEYGEGGDAWISTNDALCALLSCCIHSTRDKDPRTRGNRRAGLWLPVNARRMLDPPLPAGYIGNALTFLMVSAPSRSIESTPAKVAEIAHMIRKSIKQLDERWMRRAIAAVLSEGDLARLTSPPSPPSEDTIVFTSWASQGFYDLEWGDAIGTRIERVRWKSAVARDTCVIMPELRAPRFGDKDCGLEVVVARPNAEHMERLKQKELFMRFAERRCN